MRRNPTRSRSIGAPREAPRLVRVLGTGLPVSRRRPAGSRPARQSRCAVRGERRDRAVSGCGLFLLALVRSPRLGRGSVVACSSMVGSAPGTSTMVGSGARIAGLIGAGGSSWMAFSRVAGVADAAGLAGLEVEEHRGRRDHHAHLLRLQGDRAAGCGARRAPSAASARGRPGCRPRDSREDAAKDACCMEVLKRSSPTMPADQDQADQRHERHPRRAGAHPRHHA